MPKLRHALDAVLGARCRACGTVLGARSHPDDDLGLCPDCLSRLPPRRGGYCPLCGAMTADPEAPPLACGACRREPPPWTGLAFHGAYGALLRDLLTGFKFNGRLGLGGLIRDLATQAWALHAADWPLPQLIVPVPLHEARLCGRGFNQSLEASRGLARRLGVTVSPGALIRVRATRPQTGLSASERRSNIKDAFAAEETLVRGRRVLLVDDIMTTGGTLRECAGALLRSGAAEVRVLVLARTDMSG